MSRFKSIFFVLFFFPVFAFSQGFEWLQWSPDAGTDSDTDNFNAIATDDDGNTYMAVQFSGILNIGTYSFQSNPVEDIAILKFNGDGEFIWAKAMGSLYWDQVNGMDCDENGNLYLTGHYFGELWYENTSLYGNAGGREMFLMKITPDGNVAWAVNGANPWQEEGTDVRAMPGGGVIMSGRANNTAMIGNLQVNNPNYVLQEFIAFFDDNGVGQWIRSCGPNNSANEYYSVANLEIGADSSIYIGYSAFGEVVFNGDTIRPWYYPEFTAAVDIIVQRWSPDGDPLWASVVGSFGSDNFGDIAVDPQGRVYASMNSPLEIEFHDEMLVVEPGQWSSTILRWNADGTEDRAWHYASPSFSTLQSLMCDGNGNVWSGGTLRDSLYTENVVVHTADPLERHGMLYMIDGQNDQLERFEVITGAGWRTVGALDYNPVNGSILLGGDATAGPQAPAIFGIGEVITEGFGSPGNWAYLTSYDASPCADPLALTVSDSLICPGETASLAYPVEVFFPLWNTGDTEISVSINTAMNAEFSAVDNSGCVVHLQSEIEGAEAMSFIGSITNLQCNNSADGAIDIEILSGQEPIVISWSSGQDTEDLSNLPAGTYQFTATSAQGCSTTELFNVTQPAIINGTINESNGVLTLSNVTGGTPPYTFLWNEFANETGNSVNITEAGTYTVTITDSNGCTGTESIVATSVETSDSPVIRMGPNPTNGNFTIMMNASSLSMVESFTIESISGSRVQQERIRSTVQQVENLSPGIYLLRFWDKDGRMIHNERLIVMQ